MDSDELIRRINEKGYNVYLWDLPGDREYTSFEAAVENGLAVPQSRYFMSTPTERRGQQPFGLLHRARCFIVPACENPNSPKVVLEAARKARKDGKMNWRFDDFFVVESHKDLDLDSLPSLV